MSDAPITMFAGPFRFLSNFWEAPTFYEGVEYPTSEHAYQAAKVASPMLKKAILNCKTPGEAKKLAKSFTRRADWDDVKLGVMETILRSKFARPDMRMALMGTGDAEITEGNTWNDTFWGVCKGVGENHLGKLLMKLRKLCRCEACHGTGRDREGSRCQECGGAGHNL